MNNTTNNPFEFNGRVFDCLFENLSDFIFLINEDGTIKYASSTIQKVLGYTVEEVVGTSVLRFVHPDDLAKTKEEYIELIKHPEIQQDVLLRVVNKNGSIRIISGHRKNLLVDPEINGILISVQDITERVKVESESIKTKNLLNAVEQISGMGGWEWDIVNQKMTWTLAAYSIHDFNPDEFEEGSKDHIQRSISCYSPKDQVRISEAFEKCVSEGIPYDMECRFTTAKNRRLWIRTIGRPFYQDDKIVKVFGNLIDITENKKNNILAESRSNLIDYSYNLSLDEFLRKFLDEAEKLTESSIGFYHFVDDDQESLHLQMWSTNTLETMCNAEAKGNHYNIKDAGVWVDCFYTRKPVIHNDYKSLTHKRGMPEGHVEVIRELTVPLLRNNKVVAILGVGNKEVDYDEDDVSMVKSLADLAWDITERKKAELQRIESEEKYRKLFSEMMSGFALHKLVCNSNGNPIDYMTIEVNSAFERMLGVKSEHIINKKASEFLPQAELSHWLSIFGPVALKGTTTSYEMFSPLNNKHFEGTAYCPGIGMFAVTFYDVTERKNVEAKLNTQRIIFQNIINKTSSHLVYFDTDFNFVYVNEEYAKTCKYLPEEMIGKNHFALYPNEENEAIFKKVRDTGIEISFTDKPFDFPDQPEKGTTYWDWTLTPVKNEDEVIGLVFSLTETTHRKISELQLRASEEKYRAVIENASETISIVQNGKIIFTNPNFFKITGYHPEEMDTINQIELIHPEDRERLLKYFRDRKEGENVPDSYTFRFIDKDKNSKWINRRITDIQWEGKPAQLVFDDDITEIKLTEEKILLANERFKMAQSASNAGLWDWDIKNNNFYWSEEFYKIFEIEPNAAPGFDAWKNRLHPDDLEIASARIMEAMEKRIELINDYRIVLPNNEIRWIKAIGTTFYNNDIPYRMSGLCIDISQNKLAEELLKLGEENARAKNKELEEKNEELKAARLATLNIIDDLSREIAERKNAEEKLKHSHELMRYIIEHNRSAIAVHDRDLNYIYVSKRYLTDYNAQEKDIIGKHHYEVFPDLPQKWRDVHQRALNGEVMNAEDDPYYREDGSVEWTRWECRPWYDAVGSIGGIIVYTEVITNRKVAEEKLRKSEATLSEAMRIAKLGAWEYDVAKEQFTFNDQFYLLLNSTAEMEGGYTMPSEIYANKFLPKEERDQVRSETIKAIETNDPNYYSKLDHSLICADGKKKYIEVHIRVIKDAEGRTIKTHGVNQDITERKQSEIMLRDSEERYRHLFHTSPAPMLVHQNGILINVNDASVKMFGAKHADELLGTPVIDRVHPDFRLLVTKRIQQVSNENTSAPLIEEKLLKIDGTVIDAEVIASQIIHNGSPAVQIVLQDITQRKIQEVALRESEMKFSSVFNLSPYAIIISDISSGKYVDINESFEKMSGFSKTEVIGKTATELGLWISQEDRNKWISELSTKGLVDQLEVNFKVKDQSIITCVVASRIISLSGKNYNLSIVHDITERIKAEQALRDSEEKFRTISEQMVDLIFSTDLEGRITYISPTSDKFFGEQPNKVIGRYFTDYLTETSVQNAIAEFKFSIENQSFTNNFEIQIKRIDGTTFFGEVNAALHLEAGELVGSIGVIRDIDARKRADEALRESEEKFRHAFEYSAIGLCTIGTDKKFQKINKGFTDIFGYSEEEIKELTFNDITYPEDQSIGVDAFNQMLNKNIPNAKFEKRYVTKERKIIWTIVSSSLIRDRVGNPNFFITQILDITERKKVEGVIRAQRDFNAELISTTNLIDVTKIILHYAAQFISTECGVLYLLDNKGALQLVESFGLSEGHKRHLNLRDRNSVEDTMVYKGEIVFIDFNKIKGHPNDILLKEGIKSVVIIPLLRHSKVFSIIYLASKTVEEFAGSQKELIESFALQAGNYLDRVITTQDLVKSEEKYRRFFEADLAADFKTSANGKLIDCNNAFIKMFEFQSKEEALSTDMHLIYPKREDRSTLLKRIEQEKQVELLEINLKTISGKDLIVFESLIGEFDESGSLVGYSGFIIDVTKIKLAERLIKASEERYRHLFGYMQNGFAYHEIIVNRRGRPVDYRFLDINPIFEKMTGLKKDKVLGRTVLEVMPNTEKYWIDLYGHVALTGEPVKFENYSREIAKYFSVNAYSPEKNKFAVIVEDITETRKTEEKIRQLSRAVEQSPVSVGITDFDGNLVYVNPKFCSLTGYSESELIGNNPRVLKSGFTSSQEYKILWKTITSGKDWVGTFHNKKKNGELYWENANISPIRDSNGKITHFIAIKEDITERVKVEQELAQHRNNLENLVKLRTKELDTANLQLQEEIRKQKEYEMMLEQALAKEKELNELKTRFISTASHEFRTPLTSISLSTGLVQRYGKKWTEDKFDEHVSRINSSIGYLTRLLDEVLTISRTDSGKIVYQPVTVQLKNFCEELIKELTAHITEKHSLSFNYSLHKKEFLLDPKLLTFILSNLLSNAFKYSPKGGRVSFKVSSSKSKLIFIISDEGIGIPEEDRSHLFEPFHRSKNSVDIQGTGLGLSIVKRAVDIHQGEIYYKSELNVGTTFTIKLPRIVKW